MSVALSHRPRIKIPQPSLDETPGTGGQNGWVWAVPLPYQALAAPWSCAPMPASPHDVRESEGQFEHRLGYYACLQSFLTYSFAWTRPDKGLLWWFVSGMPTDDPRFRLIADTWQADGTLLGYLSWLALREPTEMTAATLNHFVKQIDELPLDLPTRWEAQLREARTSEPWNGGSDPMHLGGGEHVSAPSLERLSWKSLGHVETAPDTFRIVGIDGLKRTVTFVSDSIEGWYAGLFVSGEGLPARTDGHSWRVEVFVKPIGFLGTYRRSRQTGLWFSGRHRYHAIGN